MAEKQDNSTNNNNNNNTNSNNSQNIKDIKISLVALIIILLVVVIIICIIIAILKNQSDTSESENMEVENSNTENLVDNNLIEAENTIDESSFSSYSTVFYGNLGYNTEFDNLSHDDFINLGYDTEDYNHSVNFSSLKSYFNFMALYSSDLLTDTEKLALESYIATTNIGDSAEIHYIDSNYSMYSTIFSEDLSNESTLLPITDAITITQAIYNESYAYDENGNYTEDITSILSNQNEALSENNEEYYYTISYLVIINGNTTSEDDYNNHARAKTIKVSINNDDASYLFNLADTSNAQLIELDYLQSDITNPAEITIEIVDTYDGDLNSDVYISDIRFVMDSNIPQGR